MNTYGLNRHLNSFGLGYPGYFFLELETGGDPPASRIFIIEYDRAYIVPNLIREYTPVSYRIYKATPARVHQLGGCFTVALTGRFFCTKYDVRDYNMPEYNRDYIMSHTIRGFTPDRLRYFTKASNRVFVVEEYHE